ncbi:MAG TPA: hypothetical protein VN764_10705, partial [Polyangiaceae bacterium]|nr:hypothetical protein [Polyangiaceae bacterium]
MALEPMTGKSVQIDGMLREWPSGFATLSVGGAKSQSSALVGYDEQYFYFAAKIKDAHLVRTKSGSKGEDRLSLSLYVPAYHGMPSKHTIDIYPGLPGKLSALVKVDGKAVAEAEAVENPNDGGFFLEAKVPINSIPALNHVRVGLRGVLSYSDASAVGQIKSVAKSGNGQGSDMPPLTMEAETGLIQALLEPKNMNLVPDKEMLANVSGGSGAERIALYGHFLSIAGPEYKGGKQFYYNELDVESAKQVTLSSRDFNGDGKEEIILQKRLGTADKYREVIQVLQMGPQDAPVQVFGHEISIVTPDGQIENKWAIHGKGKSTKVVIEQGKVKGFDAGNYNEPLIGGVYLSALLPWQSVKSRTFAWQGAGLAQVDEATWQPKMSGPSGRPGSAAAATGKTAATGKAASTSGTEAPPPPRAPNADELLDRVYALYKQDRGVKRNSKPSFDFVTDAVGDGQMERVLVHDRDLLVFGKGFKQGLSYTYLTIGVKEAKDILSVTARDLVGDGKAEIIVHAVLNAQASESLGGDIVGRQALFVYKVQGETLKRIFAAETGRSLKKD